MLSNLYSTLSAGTFNAKNTFQQWHHLWSESKDRGMLCILQLCVDMTGFAYNLRVEDLILMKEHVQVLLESKIAVASFELRNFLQDGIFITHLHDFLKNLIVRPRNELLTDNEWLNNMIKLILAFCASKRDECVIAGSSFGIIMLLHLCTVRHNFKNNLERATVLRDRQQLELLERKRQYLDYICMAVFCDIKPGFKYAEISLLLTERVCEMFTSFPYLLVRVYKQLDLLGDIVSQRNKKSAQVVLKCLKSLFSAPISPTIIHEICLCILEIANAFVRIMDNFKSLELAVLQLFLHACSITGQYMDDEIVERVAIRLFNNDEATVNAAIELISLFHNENTVVGDLGNTLLLAAVLTFERYEYPLSALEALVEKLWRKGLFQDFEGLFELLIYVMNGKSCSFDAKSVVHAITICHQLLVADIKANISPQHGPDSISWSLIKTRIHSFVNSYPKGLAETSQHPDLFNLLLNSLCPDDKEFYGVAGINCEKYYVEVLYNTLSPVALKAIEYPMLHRTMSAIYRFDTILHISEDIWKELTENYYTYFFHTRSRLRRYNLGIDTKLMEAYTTAITRLCVLMEINNTTEDVFTLANYLGNDLRLLARMKLSDEANAIFHRLYKNTIYACVHYIVRDPSKRRSINPDQFGKQVRALMAELVTQLDANWDDSVDVGGHIVAALCDMLVLTQPVNPNGALKKLHQIAFPVDQDVLEKLAKYVARNVFNGGSDVDTILSARKLMLASYNKLYRRHSALPRLTDTCHILKHYGESVAFTEELDQLLSILYSISANDFFAIITHVIFECCHQKRFNNKLKVFFKNIHTFRSKCLESIVDNDLYWKHLIQHIVDALLEERLTVDNIEENTFVKLFSIIQPWLKQMSTENRKELNDYFRNQPNYHTIANEPNGVVYKSVKRFLHALKR